MYWRIRSIYHEVYTLSKTIIMLLTGIGNSASDSTVSVGGGGGRTAIQLTSGVDAVVAGGGGGGAGCYTTPSVTACSEISGM